MTIRDLHKLLAKCLEELGWMFVVVKLDQKVVLFFRQKRQKAGRQVTANNPKSDASGYSRETVPACDVATYR